MTRLSFGALLISALAGGLLLVAGGQTLAAQRAPTNRPAMPPDAGTIAMTRSGAASLTPPATPLIALAGAGVVPLIGGQPMFTCQRCTPEPSATATAHPGGATATPMTSSPSPRPLLPTTTRTTGLPRVPSTSPTRPAPGGTTPPRSPTTTGATPTRTPARPTPPATSTATRVVSPPATVIPGATVIAGTPGLPVASPTPLPAPPAPATTVQLWMASDFDPAADVYRSTDATVSWPAGEVLSFAPAVTLEMPSAPDPTLAYRARVIAWSFVSSGGQYARDVDVMGHAGCRLRAEPAPADATGLAGCAYRYLAHPTADAMQMQAHAFWSAGTPLTMCLDVYTYDLGQLHDTDLTVQLAIRTETIAVATGQVLARATTIRTATFAIHLVVPRSAR
ncbi:MAG: hypothetical protein WCF99_00610 [Chloroflexales bacterium]